MDTSIYGFHAQTLQGEDFSFAEYANKVLLIVNIATECGQAPQLTKLEAIYQQYKNQGFEVIAFPSNNFAQEPRNGEDISAFCSVNYGVTFKVCRKIDVKGENPDPLFKFFSRKKLNGKFSARPRWNFYKYVIDRHGNAIDYFVTYTQPDARRVIRKIETALRAV